MSDKNCFRCDGTGVVCNICGESEVACGCEPEEVDEYVAAYQMSPMEECPECDSD